MSATDSVQVLKKLIDKTAEFVADEGWEFDAWLHVAGGAV